METGIENMLFDLIETQLTAIHGGLPLEQCVNDFYDTIEETIQAGVSDATKDRLLSLKTSAAGWEGKIEDWIAFLVDFESQLLPTTDAYDEYIDIDTDFTISGERLA
jgi:hypothetical protein